MPNANLMSPNQQLGQQILRTIWFFQGCAALPIIFILGIFAFGELFGPSMYFYDFVYRLLPLLSLAATNRFSRDGLNALMASGIMFCVMIQLKVQVSAYLTLLFEASKSTFATGLWLWLILDAAFGPWQDRPYRRPDTEKPERLARAGVSVVLLLSVRRDVGRPQC
jgi:hypothetical protein